MYSVQVVWNREFDFVQYGGTYSTIDQAVAAAKAAENMGDGACVKKARVSDCHGKIVWQYGKLVKQ